MAHRGRHTTSCGTILSACGSTCSDMVAAVVRPWRIRRQPRPFGARRPWRHLRRNTSCSAWKTHRRVSVSQCWRREGQADLVGAALAEWLAQRSEAPTEVAGARAPWCDSCGRPYCSPRRTRLRSSRPQIRLPNPFTFCRLIYTPGGWSRLFNPLNTILLALICYERGILHAFDRFEMIIEFGITQNTSREENDPMHHLSSMNFNFRRLGF